ncbi:MAG: hypothetical protein LR015_06240, partial [Verrucomicrobia bacterium]|nr:hypothetical protein [Verrucomicrobiota bacterium]
DATIGGALAVDDDIIVSGNLLTTAAMTASNVSVTGTSSLGGNVTTTTGNQSYTGDMVLTSNVALTGADLESADINAGGNTLTLSGSSSVDTGAISNGNLVTLTAANIEDIDVIDATIGGALAVDDDIIVSGNLLTTAAMTASNVSVTGTSSLGGNVTTSADQSYTGDMVLTSNVALTGAALESADINAGGNTLTLSGSSSVDTGAISNGNLVTLTAANIEDIDVIDATIGGTLVVADDISVSGNLLTTAAMTASNVSVTGTSSLGGNITTSGAQNYQNSVELSADVVMTSTNSAVTFNGSLDSANTQARSLTVNAGTGSVTFTGAVGSAQALNAVAVNSSGVTRFNSSVQAGSLITDAGGSTELNGNVTTSGFQNYGDAVVITNSVLLTAGNSDITFAGTVNSNTGGLTPASAQNQSTGVSGTITVASDTNDLTVNAGNGNVTFVGAVGNSSRPGSLSVASSGQTRFNSTVEVGSLTTSGNGITLLNGNITSDGNQVYGDAILLDNDIELVTAGGLVSFASDVNSVTGENNSLNVNSGTGDIVFSGSVGTTQPLNVVSLTNTGLTRFNASVDAASLTISEGGTIELNGNITTAGAQTYNTAVILDNAVAMTTTDSSVTFNATVNSAAGEGNVLTINTGIGDVVIGADVGTAVNSNLGAVSVAAGSISQQEGTTITASGDIVLTAQSGIILASATSNSGDITVTYGQSTVGDGHRLTLQNSTLSAGGTVALGANRTATEFVEGLAVATILSIGSESITLSAGDAIEFGRYERVVIAPENGNPSQLSLTAPVMDLSDITVGGDLVVRGSDSANPDAAAATILWRPALNDDTPTSIVATGAISGNAVFTAESLAAIQASVGLETSPGNQPIFSVAALDGLGNFHRC